MNAHQFVYDVGVCVLLGAALSGAGSLIWGSSKLGAVLVVRGARAWYNMAVNIRALSEWHRAGRPVWTHVSENGEPDMRPSLPGTWQRYIVNDGADTE
jgi:hypothetical protein